jgi:cytochrome c peroxidase
MTSRGRGITLIGAGSVLALFSLVFAQGKGGLFADWSMPRGGNSESVFEVISNNLSVGQPKSVATVAAPRPPLGLPRVLWPRENLYTPEKAELGKLLFFDERLSSDGSVSCSSCHDPAKAFADGAEFPTGIGGQRGVRSTPTIINRAYGRQQFWDGRASSLEEQVLGPLANPHEMTRDQNADEAYSNVLARLKTVRGYVERFQNVFGTADFSIGDVAKAIATFERTVLSGNSPYDRYQAGDRNALTPAQLRGMDVFSKKAACDRCHLASSLIDDVFYEHDELSITERRVWIDLSNGREVPRILGFNFTDGSFQNTGIGMDRPDPDLGRYLVTLKEQERGAFKIPTLREVEHTAPYMHDGHLKTLEEVVDYYNEGGIKNPQLNQRIVPLGLSTREKEDLVTFLKALSGESWQQIKPPRREEFPR